MRSRRKAVRTSLALAQQEGDVERSRPICHQLDQRVLCRDRLNGSSSQRQDLFQRPAVHARREANYVAGQINVDDRSPAIGQVLKLTRPSSSKTVDPVS